MESAFSVAYLALGLSIIALILVILALHRQSRKQPSTSDKVQVESLQRTFLPFLETSYRDRLQAMQKAIQVIQRFKEFIQGLLDSDESADYLSLFEIMYKYFNEFKEAYIEFSKLNIDAQLIVTFHDAKAEARTAVIKLDPVLRKGGSDAHFSKELLSELKDCHSQLSDYQALIRDALHQEYGPEKLANILKEFYQTLYGEL